MSDGDARRALSALEIGVLSSHERPVRVHPRSWPRNRCSARRSSTTATGDAHYDAASALIKSIRGSDPDAALYWLARMLEGGRGRAVSRPAAGDPGQRGRGQCRSRRRCRWPWPRCRPASSSACPSASCTLAQAVTYLACAPKSNAATVGIGEARARRVARAGCCRCPSICATRTTPARSGWATAQGYQYAHDQPDGVAAQDYLGVEREYYRPVDRGFEQELAERLAAIRARLPEKAKRSTGGIAGTGSPRLVFGQFRLSRHSGEKNRQNGSANRMGGVGKFGNPPFRYFAPRLLP